MPINVMGATGLTGSVEGRDLSADYHWSFVVTGPPKTTIDGAGTSPLFIQMIHNSLVRANSPIVHVPHTVSAILVGPIKSTLMTSASHSHDLPLEFSWDCDVTRHVLTTEICAISRHIDT